jgi:hypothetical protein
LGWNFRRIWDFFAERVIALVDTLLGGWIYIGWGNFVQYIDNPTFDVRIIPAIIMTISLITFGFLTGYLVLKKIGKIKKGKETTIDVYSQNNLETLSNLLSKAKEVWILGLTLQDFQQITKTVKKILSNKGKIRILICDPNNKMMDEIEKIVYSTYGNHHTS